MRKKNADKWCKENGRSRIVERVKELERGIKLGGKERREKKVKSVE